MQVPVHSLLGEVAGQVEISEGIFAIPFNEAVVYQAMVRQLANKRQGTASTKVRGEVRGSTRKLYSQKHTGRARRGDIRSPILRGGGVTFGPRPRCYRQSIPKKMRRLAIKCLLSAKVQEGNIKVVEDFDFPQPKTKNIINLLSVLGVNSSALLLTPYSMPNIVKSASNVDSIKVMPSTLTNVLDLLSYETLICTASAINVIEKIWGKKTIHHASI
ncbi:MAG: 50S ribosomal protein L4 [Chloroflexota bacterium]|nr:50S ribosomal protein L4 [Chloroflexota bacterium]